MVFNTFFKGSCPSCHGFSKIDRVLCDSCFSKLVYVKNSCTSCGYPLESGKTLCGKCSKGEKRFINKYYVNYQYSGVLRELLLDIKFRYNLRASLFFKQIIKPPRFDTEYDAVIAVPCHFWRNFKRFWHPAFSCADFISKDAGIERSKALKRLRNTPFQHTKERAERISNVCNAFSFENKKRYKNVLLVDDIITTGSTLDECAKTLLNKGVERVDCFALSVS